ncbi:MAG TPA: hypothetical protein ACFYD7_10320 [Candidatus Wujingus californicus]|uniref:hypothetical protein n=1 Tax=Candidatus Wujingus californicus TaxID=3367618 RepID=UPI001D58B972|nr:hypothetical protein [Planctomycetota bacterium]MDO8131715.1 hypothetical protein [Candidatus Brocadiales bacterium]
MNIMEWKINKSAKGCVVCEKDFCEEEEYFSALFDENNIFTRKDFCLACWRNNTEGGHFSFWKTKKPKSDKPARKFINISVLLDMFGRLEGKDESRQKNLRYVLALYLIRKKIFKLRSLSKQNGEEVIIIYYPKEDREFTVTNMYLKEEEIEAITSEMCQLLNYPDMELDALNNSL